MNTTEQLAVITKKAWFTKNIGLATRTSRLAADCDSGWRIMAEDEDEKCFDRLEQLEFVPLEKICQLEPAFAEIMEQAEEQAFYLVNGQFQLGELPEYWAD